MRKTDRQPETETFKQTKTDSDRDRDRNAERKLTPTKTNAAVLVHLTVIEESILVSYTFCVAIKVLSVFLQAGANRSITPTKHCFVNGDSTLIAPKLFNSDTSEDTLGRTGNTVTVIYLPRWRGNSTPSENSAELATRLSWDNAEECR